MGAGKGSLERVSRGLRTLFFMVAMVVSLLVVSAPVLVAVGDVAVVSGLLSSLACFRCCGVREHVRRYSFRSSVVDVPAVSILRSLVTICVYAVCDGPGLSHGPYLGTATLCSFISIAVLTVKAFIFTAPLELDAESAPSSSAHRLGSKSWEILVLFVCSLVFALLHVFIAYRTSFRARRKLLLHRVDPEAVLSCTSVFCGSYQKVPRSPTPGSGRNSKSENGARKNFISTDCMEAELSIKLLADIDSYFFSWKGISLHYKFSVPETPIAYSFAPPGTVLERKFDHSPSWTAGRIKVDRHQFPVSSQSHLYRSFSSNVRSSLHAPLLSGYKTLNYHPPIIDIPALNLDDGVRDVHLINSSTYEESSMLKGGKFGVILVHGFGGGIFSWRHVMGVLSRQIGCPVAAFDRPGWGLTSRPCTKEWEGKQLPNPYKLDTQVDLMHAFCLEMGFSSVVLVGHDDGGLLVLKAIERFQACADSCHVEIKGIVLLSVNLSREVVPGFARILLSLGKKHIVRPLLRTEITQVVNRRAWYDATKLNSEVLNLYKAPLCVEGWDDSIREISKVSHASILSSQNATMLLKSIGDLPVLVVSGAEDKLVSLKSSQVMASKLANSRLVAISGCGHLPHEECPKELLAALSPFITRLIPVHVWRKFAQRQS